MSTEVTQKIGTVGYSRKTQPEQYQAAEASIFVQFDIGADDESTAKNAATAFALAKATVFNELALPYEIEPSGTIYETKTRSSASSPSPEQQAAANVRAAFPGAVEVPSQPAPQPAAAPAAGKKTRPAPIGETCPKCGGDEWWDNRSSKVSDKSPDYKCAVKPQGAEKACGNGKWLTAKAS